MTPAQLRTLLRQVGLQPSQAAGQNFLLDEGVAESMVDAASVGDGDTILEVGPGFGILTDALLATGAQVVTVELERRLIPYLTHKYRAQPRCRIIPGDIFRINLNDHFRDGTYHLVANLPYSATSLVFRNFLTLPPRPQTLTVMVQREVAQRITAQPGAMSLLALTVQYYCRPIIVGDVPATKFFPVPRVASTIIHGDRLRPVDRAADAKVFRCMRAGFSARRKQLHKNLAAVLKIPDADVQKYLLAQHLSPRVRAQELSVSNWLKLAERFG